MKKLLPVIVLAAALALAGCAQKKISAPAPGSESQMSGAAQKAPEAAPTPSGKEESMTEDQLAKVEKAGPEADEISGLEKLSDVYFDFDSYDIREDARPVLAEVARTLKGGDKLIVEGYCDDRGTDEYNLALGDRRATAVKKYLAALGIPASSIEVISYGEERGVCQEQTEECWARNRRGHFVLQRAK
jgi:peptidoglycan-associated lipoprotein